MDLNEKKFLNWFLLLIWMGLIFYLSNLPDLKSGLESSLDFVLRKMAHITEYGILTFLAWRAASDGGAKKSVNYLIYAFVFSVLYAISDEYHQTFVAGRVGSPVDVLIDSAGIIIMELILLRKR